MGTMNLCALQSQLLLVFSFIFMMSHVISMLYYGFINKQKDLFCFTWFDSKGRASGREAAFDWLPATPSIVPLLELFDVDLWALCHDKLSWAQHDSHSLINFPRRKSLPSGLQARQAQQPEEQGNVTIRLGGRRNSNSSKNYYHNCNFSKCLALY